jgi:hypothetical protein
MPFRDVPAEKCELETIFEVVVLYYVYLNFEDGELHGKNWAFLRERHKWRSVPRSSLPSVSSRGIILIDSSMSECLRTVASSPHAYTLTKLFAAYINIVRGRLHF